uniref:Protein kinase domain-containing protein n=1 Tax=Aplanochytrium stocchinoi TaxID=215587 RepID=A0A7S3PS15_9STRA|mmetsp:Transcript_37231/g.46564  ORF Transcript_37231/g.46564 Transcript_37231/m.46564 type:complete len:158 (+) Transcript_37231:161-634(+)
MFAGLKDRLEAAATQVLGNSLSSNYDIGDVVGSGGPEMLWTVFAAKKKDTGESCSVFVFYKGKNYLDLKGHDLESTVQHLRKEVQFLNKIRHPDILKVIEVIPESSKALAFVTEPVGKSLANVRKDFRGISPRSNSIDSNKTLVANTKIQELLGICK